MPIRLHADASDHVASFRERGLLVEVIVGAVQVIDVLRDHDALRVLPRTLADAVAGIGGTALGRPIAAQIGVPCLAARAHGGCQLLAMGVGASEAAEIATVAGPGAGHEKRHVGRLRYLLGAGGSPERHKRSGGQNGCMQLGCHGVSSRFDAGRFDDAGFDQFLPLPSATQYRVADKFGYRFTDFPSGKPRLELDGAVCRVLERSMLTPRPDFGKATHSPCGHSKRARHRGASPPLRYRSALPALNRS